MKTAPSSSPSRFHITPRLGGLLLVGVLLPGALWSIFAQGLLTPPAGAPAPVMKTLSQVEPRTDLQALVLPPGVATDATTHFIINQPGSYYLSKNLDVTLNQGIKINAEGVTLDLNGFQISRAAGTGGEGIVLSSGCHRAMVHNGSITGFASGLYGVSSAPIPRGCCYRNLRISACTSAGLRAGEGSVLIACTSHDCSGLAAMVGGKGSSFTNCTIYHNTSIYGLLGGESCSLSGCTVSGNTLPTDAISVADGGTLINCAAYDNTCSVAFHTDNDCTLTGCNASRNSSDRGFSLSTGCTMTGCTASNNTGSTTTSRGILAGAGCTLTGCTARRNFSTNANLNFDTGAGIVAGDGSTVSGCTAQGNTGDGIQVSANCRVTGNNCDGNGADNGNGSGVHVIGGANRIENNNLTNNTAGLRVDGTVNLIVGNSARNNTTGGTNGNYNIVANNRVGEMITPPLSGAITGNGTAGGAGLGTGSPLANFAY